MSGRPVSVLVESMAQAAWLASQLRLQPDLKAVALTPEAASALERHGIPFRIDDDYCNEDTIRELGASNLRQVERFCDWMDQYVHSRSVMLREIGFKPASFGIFQLKVLFDAITLRLYTLKCLLDQEQPQELWFFEAAEPADIPRTLFFGKQESIFASLVPLCCRNGFSSVGVRKLQNGNYRQTAKRELVPSLSQKAWEFFSTDPWRAARVVKRFVGSGGKRSAVVLDRRLLIELLSAGKYDVMHWDPAGARPALPVQEEHLVAQCAEEMRAIWREMSLDPQYRQYLTSWSIDFSPVVERRLAYYCTAIIPDALRTYFRARTVFRRIEAPLLVSLSYGGYERCAAAAAARSLAIPVVVVQHGSYGYFDWPIIYHTDIKPADYALLWGNGVVRHCARRFPNGAALLAIGSTKLDAISEKARDSQRTKKLRLRLHLSATAKVVVYGLTNMSGNIRYISGIIRSDHKHVATHRSIIQIFKDFPDISLLVKVHPSRIHPDPAVTQFTKDQAIANCQVIRDVPFEELVLAADLVILDSPTTTLLEALAARKRTLVLNEFFGWEDGAAELLRKAAIFSDDLSQFHQVLRRELTALREGPPPEPPTASLFLNEFGTLSGDGRSAQRLTGALAAIAEKSGHEISAGTV